MREKGKGNISSFHVFLVHLSAHSFVQHCDGAGSQNIKASFFNFHHESLSALVELRCLMSR